MKMPRPRTIVAAAAGAILALLAGVALYGWTVVNRPGPPFLDPVVVDIPPGYRSEQIVDALIRQGVLSNRPVSLAYLYFSPYRGRLQAGEYQFDEPLDVRAVFEMLATGNVRLHAFTVPEGLRVDQVADRWEAAGFGTRDAFLEAAANAMGQIRRIDPDAVSAEGYLFPETYMFRRAVTAAEAVTAMIGGLEDALARLRETTPEASWPLDVHDMLVMASLVEGEAAHADERPVISSVFHNRLDRNMRMECDPTVIYALVLADQYRGRLLRADLTFDSPYNTYRYAGLPPGPISSPGFDSMRAAIAPGESDFIFFVRTEGGRHAFSRTLAEHNRNVAAYRRMQ